MNRTVTYKFVINGKKIATLKRQRFMSASWIKFHRALVACRNGLKTRNVSTVQEWKTVIGV